VKLTLIRGGELYGPEPLGRQDVLIAAGQILKIGEMDRSSLSSVGLDLEVTDASGCLVVPGLIDPHQHLIGAGGEQGFGSRMPEVPFGEIAQAGITTVVGCLGTDTTTRHLTSLLAKARQLKAQGLSAHIYTGGFPVPPPTLTGSITDDLVIVEEVIGVGEVAISDRRGSAPSVPELARLVHQAVVGGMVGGKAGCVHFHVGAGSGRLSPLHALLDEYEIEPRRIYATHINRSPELMNDAVALARRGAFVDIDTVEEDLPRWLRAYLEQDGPPGQLTVSSDAYTPGGMPAKLLGGLTSCLREGAWPAERLLPLFTSNPASVLGLGRKGRLREGMDADILLLDRDSLHVSHLFAMGEMLVRSGRLEDDARRE
jgi:beta-aspartyl-dipeptidase (metallo-type)